MTKKKRRFMARQGDVLVMTAPRPIGTFKKVARENGDVILAYGEVTGHAHRIENPMVCLLRAEGISDAALTVGSDLAQLVHEEHGAIPVPRGKYVVRIQREFTGEISRRVED